MRKKRLRRVVLFSFLIFRLFIPNANSQTVVDTTFTLGSSRTEIFDNYDVVYVNWVKGSDFIQRNALALQEAIVWINQQKAAAGVTAANVVLGQSMGGLVADRC